MAGQTIGVRLTDSTGSDDVQASNSSIYIEMYLKYRNIPNYREKKSTTRKSIGWCSFKGVVMLPVVMRFKEMFFEALVNTALSALF